jgi:hypothetical protein
MKAMLALLVLTFVPRSYGESIKDDVDKYDASVVSANTHFADGRVDFSNSQFKDAKLEYVEGKQAVETAKRLEKDIRAYLDGHSEEPQLIEIKTHVDERSKELAQIDANLEVLDEDLVSKSLKKETKKHLIVPVGEGGGSKTAIKPQKDTQNIYAP